MIQLKLNPKNPRRINDKEFERLKNKIKEFPDMLLKRPIVYDENNVILGGNMRYRALQQLENEGLEIKDGYFSNIADWTEEQKDYFIINDNISDGIWDWDVLANEWSEINIDDWGLNVFGFSTTTDEQNVHELWKEAGMPDYGDPSGKKPYRSIMVHFAQQEDVVDFAEKLKQTISEKTKFVWYPYKGE